MLLATLQLYICWTKYTIVIPLTFLYFASLHVINKNVNLLFQQLRQHFDHVLIAVLQLFISLLQLSPQQECSVVVILERICTMFGHRSVGEDLWFMAGGGSMRDTLHGSCSQLKHSPQNVICAWNPLFYPSVNLILQYKRCPTVISAKLISRPLCLLIC